MGWAAACVACVSAEETGVLDLNLNMEEAGAEAEEAEAKAEAEEEEEEDEESVVLVVHTGDFSSMRLTTAPPKCPLRI